VKGSDAAASGPFVVGAVRVPAQLLGIRHPARACNSRTGGRVAPDSTVGLIDTPGGS